ncbi:hypothetical protein [Oceanospirillum maris]|uniref:hypothetical protein n=1 Tax=Oceanospirillum maris TaxID=64977 RepID=UPI0004134F1F|nr:hypothetical protein [Oceanospirillum maris]
MANVEIVRTKKQLERALDNEADYIVIKNQELADHVQTVNTASKAALTAVLGGSALALTNSWNPLGWGAAAITALTGGSLALAIIALGLGVVLIWAIYKNYRIKAKGKVTLPDGTEVEGELVLERT